MFHSKKFLNMKNLLNKWTTFVLAGTSITCLIGCNDDFLEEKKLWGKYSEATVYTNYETATNRIDNIYYMLYPGQNEGNGSQASLISTGTEDVWAKTTEEYGGLSNWENSTLIKTYNDVEDHFYVENKEISPYGHVREINEVIENVQKYSKGHLTDEQINNILGQAYFLRAWRYYLMVKWYGGVPIIDKVQDALVGNGEGLNLVVPRSSTKKCIQFICNDLDKAAKLLPLQWENEAEDWGRVTAGTALALKGRILLHWASPLWNRKNDLQRWQAAYEANKNALDTLALGGYGLAYENNAGSQKQSAANWAKIFLNTKGSDGNVNEAVFVTLYNKVQKVDNQQRWNGWEQSVRPKNTYGGGGKHPTAEMVDLFLTENKEIIRVDAVIGMEIPPVTGMYAVKLWALDTMLYNNLIMNDKYLFNVPYLKFINKKYTSKKDTMKMIDDILLEFKDHNYTIIQTLTNKKGKPRKLTSNECDSFLYALRMYVKYYYDNGIEDEVLPFIININPLFIEEKETTLGKKIVD